MNEIWKPVAGYEGKYEVSDLGRVKSLLTNKMLRPGIASHGYPTVSLSQKTRTVHSLVMEAFVGARPKDHQVCHNNGVRADARLVNLRYGTRKENQADAFRHGTRVIGSMYLNAKLNEEKARFIREMKGKISQSKLAEMFSVSPAAIQGIHDGRTWKHA